MGFEGIFLDVVRMSTGNPVSVIKTVVSTGATDTTMTTYSYRDDGRPVSASYSHSAWNIHGTLHWYYSD